MSDPFVSIWTPRDQFFKGQTICGKILIEFPVPTKLSFLKISIEGFEKSMLQAYYINYSDVLCGSESSSGTGEPFDRGATTFDFSYTIPEDVPLSFQESENLGVFYKITCTCGIAKKKIKIEKPFYVVADHSFEPPGIPQTQSDTKSSGLTLMATVESAVCIGEELPVYIKVRKTEKSPTVKSATVKLFQHRVRKSVDTTEEIDFVFFEETVKEPSLKTKEDGFWESTVKIPISPLWLPTSFTKHKLIVISYWMEVILEVKLGFNMRVKLPVELLASRFILPKWKLESLADSLVDKMLKRSGLLLTSPNDSKEMIQFSAILFRYPIALAEPMAKVLSHRIKNEKEYTTRLLVLYLFEACSLNCGTAFVNALDTSLWDNVLKKLLTSKEMTNGLPRSRKNSWSSSKGAMDLPNFTASEKTFMEKSNSNVDIGTAIDEKIVSLVLHWCTLNLKWKDGPLKELSKLNRTTHRENLTVSFFSKTEQEMEIVTQLKVVDTPILLKGFIMDTLRDIILLQTLNNWDNFSRGTLRRKKVADREIDDDEFWDSSLFEICQRLAENLVRCIPQIEKTIEKGKKDKMQEGLLKILAALADQARATVPMPVLAPKDPLGAISKVVLDNLNRCTTHGGLETKTFGFFELHLMNATRKVGFPKEEDVLGIFDVTASSSCKNCLVFGDKSMYYFSSKGKGSVAYTDLKSRPLTIKKEENVLMVDDHVIYCYSSDRFDALVKVVDHVKTGLESKDSFLLSPEMQQAEKKKKKEKKPKSRVREPEESNSQASPKAPSSPGKAEATEPSNGETKVGQLISFDSFLVAN